MKQLLSDFDDRRCGTVSPERRGQMRAALEQEGGPRASVQETEVGRWRDEGG